MLHEAVSFLFKFFSSNSRDIEGFNVLDTHLEKCVCKYFVKIAYVCNINTISM